MHVHLVFVTKYRRGDQDGFAVRALDPALNGRVCRASDQMHLRQKDGHCGSFGLLHSVQALQMPDCQS